MTRGGAVPTCLQSVIMITNHQRGPRRAQHLISAAHCSKPLPQPGTVPFKLLAACSAQYIQHRTLCDCLQPVLSSSLISDRRGSCSQFHTLWLHLYSSARSTAHYTRPHSSPKHRTCTTCTSGTTCTHKPRVHAPPPHAATPVLLYTCIRAGGDARCDARPRLPRHRHLRQPGGPHNASGGWPWLWT